MIYAIGSDIVQIERIRKKYQRSGEDFAKAILSLDEWQDWQTCAELQKAAFLAKRFAAKEALAKSLKTGFREPISLQNISILHDKNSAPYFELSDDLQKYLNESKIKRLHLTISDEKEYAIAFVVAEL